MAWARLALLALLGSVLVLLVAAGLKGLPWALAAVAGVALTAVGLWWVLAHSGVVRAVGALVAVLVPIAVPALFATQGMLWPACLSWGLWILALAAARIAITPAGPSAGRTPAPGPVPAAQHPWVVMNPRSGGGKVDRFHLVEQGEAARWTRSALRHHDVPSAGRRT